MRPAFDVIVVGGGSGGVAFARRAAGLGASVCLIEKAELGGTCINRGCVPKKLMWQAAWTHQQALAACAHGLGPVPPPPDFATLQGVIGAKVRNLRGSYGDRLDDAGVTRRTGEAHVVAAGRVVIDGETLHADHLVLATGATPQLPPLEGRAHLLTSDDLFGWRALPSSVALIGGGYIGCEFAAIFAGFGVEVTVIDTDDRLLPGFDADIADAVRAVMRDRGIELRLGATPTAVTRLGDRMELAFDGGAPLTADRVIAATGRAPCTRLTGGFCARLDIAESGAFAVDAGLATSVPGIYAVGDCADRLPLTPVATGDGETLAERLFGADRPALPDLSRVARSAFVMPPVAEIGETGDAGMSTGRDLIEGALTPPDHWTTRTARKVAPGEAGLRGVAAMGAGAPDIVASLGIGLEGAGIDAVTGVHPSFAEEFLGRD